MVMLETLSTLMIPCARPPTAGLIVALPAPYEPYVTPACARILPRNVSPPRKETELLGWKICALTLLIVAHGCACVPGLASLPLAATKNVPVTTGAAVT